MKIAYVRKPFEFKLVDRDMPVPEADEVLLSISCCGVCGTDLHIAGHLAEGWTAFGHEIVGTVLETGREVGNVKAGDRVALESSSFCGNCDNCRNGRVDVCSAIIDWKKEHNGGFAEYMTVCRKGCWCR